MPTSIYTNTHTHTHERILTCTGVPGGGPAQALQPASLHQHTHRAIVSASTHMHVHTHIHTRTMRSARVCACAHRCPWCWACGSDSASSPALDCAWRCVSWTLRCAAAVGAGLPSKPAHGWVRQEAPMQGDGGMRCRPRSCSSCRAFWAGWALEGRQRWRQCSRRRCGRCRCCRSWGRCRTRPARRSCGRSGARILRTTSGGCWTS